MGLPANLLETTQADLESLVSDQVQEGPDLDFKRSLPVTWDNAARHDFLADATAFANAAGGDILFGIDEDADARASALVPQSLASADQEVRRLQDFMLNSAEPRMPGTQVHAVAVDVGGVAGHAIIVRVPQSWAGPHRVKTNQHFFIRDGLRKRQLDIPEIRALFLRSDSQVQRIRDFRTDRLGKILTGETPSELMAGPVLVAHVVPTQAALGLVQLDPVPYQVGQRCIPMIGRTAPTKHRLNLDGVVGSLNPDPLACAAYTQVFRNGFFEAASVLRPTGDVKEPVLSSTAYEKDLNEFLMQVRAELAAAGVSQDMAVMLSLLRAEEVMFAAPGDFGIGYERGRFDRKVLLIPDVLLSARESVGKGMRSAYDLVSQSAGHRGSQNYGPDGEWKAPR